MKNLSLGTTLNSVVGMLGINADDGEMDLAGIVGSIASGGALLGIVSAVKPAMGKQGLPTTAAAPSRIERRVPRRTGAIGEPTPAKVRQ
jgi:hypothetical protein